MKTTVSILLLSFSLFCISGCMNFKDALAHFNNKRKNKIELRLQAPVRTFSLSKKEYPKTKVSINNFSKDTIKIVQPGDGSRVEWRTPIIRWSVIELGSEEVHPDSFPELPKIRGSRCGNMNSLSMREIVRLRPKYGVKLQWTSSPPIPRKAGKYSVKFYYQNIPDLKWRGFSRHNSEAMEVVRNETKAMLLVSNELIFEVTE